LAFGAGACAKSTASRTTVSWTSMARRLPKQGCHRMTPSLSRPSEFVVPRFVSMLFNLTLIIAFLVLAAFLHITLQLLEPIDRSRHRE
jgi:hypothetical protein